MLSNTNSNYSHYEFSDIVEKLTECEIGKSFSWVKKWLVVQGNNFLFFSKRLGSDSEISQPEEAFHFEKPLMKCFKEYKTASLKNKKNYVCVVSSANGINPNGNLIFAVKCEKILNSLREIYDCGKIPLWTQKNLSKKLFGTVNQVQDKPTYNPINTLNAKIKSSSDKKDNPLKKSNEKEYVQNKENYNNSNLPNRKQKNISKKIFKHKKTLSCGNYESDCIKNKEADQDITSKVISTEAVYNYRFKSTNSFILMEKQKNIEEINNTCKIGLQDLNKNKIKKANETNKDNIFTFKSNENSLKKLKSLNKNNEENNDLVVPTRKRRKLSCQIMKNTNKLKIDDNNLKNEKSFDSISSLEKITPLPVRNSIIVNNEENSSLSKIINNMLISSKKVYKFKQRVTDSFVYLEGEEKDIFDCTDIEKTGSNKEINENTIRTLKRKKHINKMIKLSLPQTDNSSENKDKKVSYHFNRLNFNQSLLHNEDDEVSANMNIDLSREEISFDDRSNDASKNIRITQIIKRIENLDEYIYDPYSLKKLLKSYNLKKKDLGLLHDYLPDDKQFLKSQLLTEMIALISKRFLNESINKSLEIVLKEKEINKNYFISSSHPHSIEYCIVDIFNTFLGANKESEEFYNKFLPNYLAEMFLINFQLYLKTKISIPNLFVLMEYHNKIYFNDNIDINFANSTPFVVHDIKYISSYRINKWYKISSRDSDKGKGNLNNSVYPIVDGSTNIKRMKYNNFEMKDSFDKMLQQFKDSERSNDEMRISLVKNINFHILNKRSELALKLCDYYFQRYADTLFLNPNIYIILSEIYSEISGIKLARIIYEKAVSILNWQFSGENNPLLIDINYTFSLILMKQSMNILENNSHPKSDDVHLEYQMQILQLLEKSKILCEKFLPGDNHKMAKIILQINYIKIFNIEIRSIEKDRLDVRTCVDEILKSIEILHRGDMYIEEACYLNLFSDIFSDSPYFEDEVKIMFLQKLHEVKKIIKTNGRSLLN